MPLIVSASRRKTHGDKAFIEAAVRACYVLPPSLQLAFCLLFNFITIFCRRLKTELLSVISRVCKPGYICLNLGFGFEKLQTQVQVRV